MAAPTPQQIAELFVKHYYETFDANRAQLRGLYRGASMLSFEGDHIRGDELITEKLAGLPFAKVEHKVNTFDVQPSHESIPSLLVSVTGLLLVDDNENPLQFSQIFHLMPEGGSYYVFNDIFRLNYG